MKMFLKVLIVALTSQLALCSLDDFNIFKPPSAVNQRPDPCKPPFWFPRSIPDYCDVIAHFKLPATVQVLIIAVATDWALCAIDGLSYMDTLNFKPLPPGYPRDDPCNPPYWYPRNVPDYCAMKVIPPSDNKPPPVPPPMPPAPIPVPAPGPMPYPWQPPMPYMPPAPFMPMPPPIPIAPVPPLPYGIPILPSAPMLPVGGLPYPFIPPPFPIPGISPGFRPAPQAGMVPGLPGLVSPDGGINIMPMSDAYSDLLEKHKQKMIRKRLEKLAEKYDSLPWAKEYRRRRNYRRRTANYD